MQDAGFSPEAKKDEPRIIPMDGSLFDNLSLLRDEISDPEKRQIFGEQLLRAKTYSLNYASTTLDYLLEKKEKLEIKKEEDTDHAPQISDQHQLANVFSTLNLMLGGNLNARLDIEAPQFTKEELKRGNVTRKLLNRIDVAAMEYAFSRLRKYRELIDYQGRKPEEALQELDFPPGLTPEEIQSNFLKKIDLLPPSVSGPLLDAKP